MDRSQPQDNTQGEQRRREAILITADFIMIERMHYLNPAHQPAHNLKGVLLQLSRTNLDATVHMQALSIVPVSW
jgi:hypothetical protein